MTAEPFEPEFHFSKGQRVRIVEGPFTEFVGRVSESHREQKKVTVLMESTSFSGFSIEAVARRADVARMTIYHQFGSKMGLLEALCDSLAVTGEMEQLMVFPTLRRRSSPSVGASGVGLGGVGLHGRPRPVPLAPILVEDDRLPHPRATIKAINAAPNPPSTALAPTDRPASCLTSRFRLMRMRA